MNYTESVCTYSLHGHIESFKEGELDEIHWQRCVEECQTSVKRNLNIHAKRIQFIDDRCASSSTPLSIWVIKTIDDSFGDVPLRGGPASPT